MKMDSAWIEGVIGKFQDGKNVKKVISKVVSDASGSGEGFTSSLERWECKLLLGSGRIITRSYIVKYLPEAPLQRLYIQDYGMMQKEIKIYEQIFGDMETLMLAYNDKREKLWCDLIGYRPHDVLVLQDLRDLNYRTNLRVECLDEEHGVLAIRNLARFHAMSMVLLQNGSLKKDDLPLNPIVYDGRLIDMFQVGGVNMLQESMRESWDKEWGGTADILLRETKLVKKKIRSMVEACNEKLNVLAHGDIWICNMLFKYDDYRNIPIDVKFIDFQLTGVDSLGLDLQFFLYCCFKPVFRRKIYEELLDAYVDSLGQTLRLFNYQGSPPTREEVNREMEVTKYYGFLCLVNMYPIATAECRTDFDFDVYKEGRDKTRGFRKEPYKTSRFKSDVEEELKKFVAEGLI